MMDHKTIKIWINLYLDGELSESEFEKLKEHIKGCNECSKLLKEERNFTDALRILRDSYTADDSFKQEMADKIKKFTKPRKFSYTKSIPVLILLFALTISLVIFYSSTQKNNFTDIAVQNHLRQIKGQLPLEIKTSSEVEISNWFNGKLSFNFRLPRYPDPKNRPYEIKGARLVALNNDYAALVSYVMDDRPMTLLVASSKKAKPEGKRKIRYGDIDFYLDSKDGVNILSWTDRGLTYALVFDFENFNWKRPCIVCHSHN